MFTSEARSAENNRSAVFQQQERIVKGKVLDENGKPVSDATVGVKGRQIFTTTKDDGSFSILVPSGSNIITVTHIGMMDQEISIVGKETVDIKMSSVGTSMDDVVVIGYGAEKRSRINGSVVTVNMNEIQDLPVGNLGVALAGRLLGVGVSGGAARPGVAAQITVRNPITISKDGGNNDPLYVIDDVIQVTPQGLNDATLFNSLDPSEVESITILKDAAAAIYGSRGAAGAIIVKTKRGKMGKPRFTYSGSVAHTDEAYRTKMMSAYELARYINIINGPNGANVLPNNSQFQNFFFSEDELEHYKTINHDWLDNNWKASLTTRNTMNVSGGADRATYFASITHFGQDGNIGRLNLNKWTFRAGSDIQVASGVKVGINVSGFQGNDIRTNSKIGGENIENDYRNLLRAPKYIPEYIDGLPVKLPPFTTFANNIHSYHLGAITSANNLITGKESFLTVNLNAEYDVSFIPGLKIRGAYARNSSSSRSGAIGTRYALYNFNMLGDHGHIFEGATLRGSGLASNDNRIRNAFNLATNYQANFTTMYMKSFGDHSINAFFSIERAEQESNQDEVLREAPASFTNGQLNTAFGTIDGRTFAYEGGSLGYVGRINYSYTNRYSVNFMYRSDASTKLAPENYWGNFYSVGLGWTISEEKFFKSEIIDFLKFRYSFGQMGKDDTRAWQWRQRFTFQNGQGGVFGNSSSAPASVGLRMEVSPNRNARWSQDFKNNFGFDAKMFNNKVSVTLEGFYNLGRNIFVERIANVPVTVGGSLASENFANFDFFGTELSIGYDGNIGKDFRFGIEGRFSWADNKVLKNDYNEQDLKFPWNARPGQSFDNGVWGYDYLGMFRSQDEIDAFVNRYGITQMFDYTVNQFRPGMLYYRDVRGPLQPDGTFAGPDGIIDNNDQIQLAQRRSNRYGFGSTIKFGYKNFSFDCVIAGSFGGGWSEMDARGPLERNISNLFQNGPAYWGSIYDPELNPNGVYPNPFWSNTNNVLSNFWRVNAFRMRMRSANLSYSLPRSIAQAARINSARVFLSAINPLNLFNPFNYKDSEGAWDTYPVLRTLSLGINVSF